MAWLFITGTVKTANSQVIKFAEKRGYKFIALPAPSAKYIKPGYTGPRYIDDLMALYLEHTNKDIVWDRTPHEEFLWSNVYGTNPLIPEEELSAFIEMEQENSSKYFVIIEPDIKEHWKKCVQSKQGLTQDQFKTARILFMEMATKYGFNTVTSDNLGLYLQNKTATSVVVEKIENTQIVGEEELCMTNNAIMTTTEAKDIVTVAVPTPLITDTAISGYATTKDDSKVILKTPEQMRLDKANVLSDILESRILKKKGGYHDQIENDIRNYLNDKLAALLGMGEEEGSASFNKEEVKMLKTYCAMVKDKINKGGR